MLAPTCELARQVMWGRRLKSLHLIWTLFLLMEWFSILHMQQNALSHGVGVVVGTASRIIGLIKNSPLKLGDIEYLMKLIIFCSWIWGECWAYFTKPSTQVSEQAFLYKPFRLGQKNCPENIWTVFWILIAITAIFFYFSNLQKVFIPLCFSWYNFLSLPWHKARVTYIYFFLWLYNFEN